LIDICTSAVALVVGSCSGASDELVEGGLLYDNWPVAADVAAPTGNQALWASQSTNEREGVHTYRCKECHGWDYKGAEGAYGSGSHFTGFPGIMEASDKTGEELTTALTSGDHDFSTLGEDQIASLVTFIQEGLADYGQYIDTETKAVVDADVENGEQLFTSLCRDCHGNDGQTLNSDRKTNQSIWETSH
jgi:mono/diheme cytochrome c family protein